MSHVSVGEWAWWGSGGMAKVGEEGTRPPSEAVFTSWEEGTLWRSEAVFTRGMFATGKVRCRQSGS